MIIKTIASLIAALVIVLLWFVLTSLFLAARDECASLECVLTDIQQIGRDL